MPIDIWEDTGFAPVPDGWHALAINTDGTLITERIVGCLTQQRGTDYRVIFAITDHTPFPVDLETGLGDLLWRITEPGQPSPTQDEIDAEHARRTARRTQPHR